MKHFSNLLIIVVALVMIIGGVLYLRNPNETKPIYSETKQQKTVNDDDIRFKIGTIYNTTDHRGDSEVLCQGKYVGHGSFENVKCQIVAQDCYIKFPEGELTATETVIGEGWGVIDFSDKTCDEEEGLEGIF